MWPLCALLGVLLAGGPRVTSQELSFLCSAENKMMFQLTVLNRDLLLFSAYDARAEEWGDPRGEFGAQTRVSRAAAGSYVRLRGLLEGMCERGGEQFRSVVFELDGFTCVGFLHEMWVATIIGAQQHDATAFQVLQEYSTERARIVLFQNRYNEYQHVLGGVLDWRYLGTKNTESSKEISGIVSGPQTALIVPLSEEVLCSTLSPKIGIYDDLFVMLIKDSLLNAEFYWSGLSVYVGYDRCHVSCGMTLADAEALPQNISFHLENKINEVISTRSFLSLHFVELSAKLCYPKEASKLLLYEKLTAFACNKTKNFDYNHFMLLHDISPSFSSPNLERNPSHIFNSAEKDTPDTLIPRKRSPFDIFVTLDADCVQSIEHIVSCTNIFHVRLPRSFIEILSGNLYPLSSKNSFLNSLLGQVDDSAAFPRSALATMVLYYYDILQPFLELSFFAVDVNNSGNYETKSIASLSLPSMDYFLELINIRYRMVGVLRAQNDNRRMPVTTSTILFPSAIREKQLLQDPNAILYSRKDVYYNSLCHKNDCSVAPLSKVIAPQRQDVVHSLPTSEVNAKIAFFTTILGEYETACPSVSNQKHEAVDFICFTNSQRIISSATEDTDNPWIIDSYPYHFDDEIWSQISQYSTMYENIKNKASTEQDYYTIVKFYKMNFYLFPRMKQYDYVVWMDGTIEVHSDMAAHIVRKKLDAIAGNGFHMMLFEHTRKTLLYEAMASAKDKRWANKTVDNSEDISLNDTLWEGKNDVMSQLKVYDDLGYSESEWFNINSQRPLYGLWVTCFIAFDMRDSGTMLFLQAWFTHIQVFSSQCQMSYCFLSQKNQIIDSNGFPFRPYSLPDEDIHGTNRVNTLFRKKRYHGVTSI